MSDEGQTTVGFFDVAMENLIEKSSEQVYYKLYEKDNVVLYVGMNYGNKQH